jgi:ParB-like chromosome segregation protein Spo0J
MTGTLKEIAKGRSDIFYVDPRELQIKAGWNCRDLSTIENRDHVRELAESIAEIGVVSPLTVFREGDKIYVSDGHCRLAATLYAIHEMKAPIASVPVKTEGRSANEADYVLRQILDGKPKTAFELGAVCKRLVGFGWTIAEIAKRSGKSPSAINAALDLQGAAPEVQKMVASGRISASLAAKTVKAEGVAAADTLTKAIDHAKQRGSEKATARDIGEAPKVRQSKIALVAEIVERGYKAGEYLESADHTILSLDTDDWIDLQKLLGI